MQKFNENLRNSYHRSGKKTSGENGVRVSEYKENYSEWPTVERTISKPAKSWTPIVVAHGDMNAAAWESEHKSHFTHANDHARMKNDIPAGLISQSGGVKPSFFAWELTNQHADMNSGGAGNYTIYHSMHTIGCNLFDVYVPLSPLSDPSEPPGSVQGMSNHEHQQEFSEYGRNYQWPPLNEVPPY